MYMGPKVSIIIFFSIHAQMMFDDRVKEATLVAYDSKDTQGEHVFVFCLLVTKVQPFALTLQVTSLIKFD